MNHKVAAKAFNEWMRRYTDEPDSFQREWSTIKEFLKEVAKGKEPTYGETCAAYLEKLAVEIETK